MKRTIGFFFLDCDVFTGEPPFGTSCAGVSWRLLRCDALWGELALGFRSTGRHLALIFRFLHDLQAIIARLRLVLSNAEVGVSALWERVCGGNRFGLLIYPCCCVGSPFGEPVGRGGGLWANGISGMVGGLG
jgi:hypothetical protein